MSNNSTTSEKLTFWELIQKHKIEIPIIQRDFAQGRESNFEIRKNFLNALSKAFDSKEPLELDFIYGGVRNDSLQPLDGQQRLTTLFLLHWYAASKQNKLAEIKNKLEKFTYETRTSSREFCFELINKGIDFQKMLLADVDNKGVSKENQLSKTIIDTTWFFLSWKKDPTIKAMLNMLDAIHLKFHDGSNLLWEKLTIENKVVFHYIELKNFGLTDDLYIKMNARGKPLTEFENYKAKFEQYIQKHHANLKAEFSKKIDGIWTDLFWNYRNKENNLFDVEFMNFFRIIATNQYALNNVNNINLSTDIELLRSKLKLSFDKYADLNCINNDSLKLIIDVLDKLSLGCSGKENVRKWFANCDYLDEESMFNVIINYNLGYAELVTFYAYCLFLTLEKEIDIIKLAEWMRVIRNLVEGSRLTYYNNAQEYASSIKTVAELSLHRNNIINYLATAAPSNIKGFLGIQVEEEILKSKLILKNTYWKDAICAIENHGYFKGQIGFLLKFSGIATYFRMNNNIDWDNVQNTHFYGSFCNYVEKTNHLFDKKGLKKISEHLFERALLSKGDYLLTKSRNHSFLNNEDRDISWKRLLRDDNERRDVVKSLFDSISSISVLEDLQKQINEFNEPNDWRYYFIKQPEIINACGNNKLIRWNDENDILLLESTTTSGYHLEYYSYAFCNVLREQGYKVKYCPQRSREDVKFFIIGNSEVLISYIDGRYRAYFSSTKNFEYGNTQEELLKLLEENQYFSNSSN